MQRVVREQYFENRIVQRGICLIQFPVLRERWKSPIFNTDKGDAVVSPVKKYRTIVQHRPTHFFLVDDERTECLFFFFGVSPMEIVAVIVIPQDRIYSIGRGETGKLVHVRRQFVSSAVDEVSRKNDKVGV